MWNECSCVVIWTFFDISLVCNCNENGKPRERPGIVTEVAFLWRISVCTPLGLLEDSHGVRGWPNLLKGEQPGATRKPWSGAEERADGGPCASQCPWWLLLDAREGLCTQSGILFLLTRLLVYSVNSLGTTSLGSSPPSMWSRSETRAVAFKLCLSHLLNSLKGHLKSKWVWL